MGLTCEVKLSGFFGDKNIEGKTITLQRRAAVKDKCPMENKFVQVCALFATLGLLAPLELAYYLKKRKARNAARAGR